MNSVSGQDRIGVTALNYSDRAFSGASAGNAISSHTPYAVPIRDMITLIIIRTSGAGSVLNVLVPLMNAWDSIPGMSDFPL